MKKIVILLLIGIIGIDASHKMSQEITNSNRKESDKERLYKAQFALVAAFYLAYFDPMIAKKTGHIIKNSDTCRAFNAQNKQLIGVLKVLDIYDIVEHYCEPEKLK